MLELQDCHLLCREEHLVWFRESTRIFALHVVSHLSSESDTSQHHNIVLVTDIQYYNIKWYGNIGIYFIINCRFLNFIYEEDISDQVMSFPIILF